jgi:hypothetical protein
MNKSTRNLLIVFVILSVVVFVFFKGKEHINTQNVEPKLFTADSSKIDKIEIIKKNESIVLEKKDGMWQVTKPVVYPADTNAVNPILGELQHFTVDNIISTNPEKFNTYLDSVNHPMVSVFQEGKDLGTFELGKYAVSYQNSYIKKPDENKILLASNLNQSLFVKPLKDFRYKVIFSLPKLTINRIDFKSTDSTNIDFSAVEDSTGKWFIGNDSIPQNNIDGYLNLMAAFTTDDFVDSAVTLPAQPTYTVTIHMLNAQPIVINLYKQATTPVTYIVQVSNNKQLFRITEGMVPNVARKRTDLIPAPPKTDNKETPKTKEKKKK